MTAIDRRDLPVENGGSLWQATAPPGPLLPVLAGDVDAEILVIGGGVAGLSTALHLAERGVAVALVEAGAVGSGATGASGGLIAPDYIRHTPETIGQQLGRAAGERLTRFVGESAAQVFALARALSTPSEVREEGFWTPTHSETLAARQRAVAAQWALRGFSVRFAEGEEARAQLGSDRYIGALVHEEGGGLNPLALARALADQAVRQGALLFAQSPVQRLRREDGRWVATTTRGRARARRVVLAANAGNAALHPRMARTTLPLDVYEFATAPVDAGLRQRILPEGGGFTDKTSYVFTARYDDAGHLVSAFPASLAIRGRAAARREAQRRLSQYFPELANVEIRFLWEGHARINTSFLPALYDLGEGALAIQACNGRGLSTNAMLGRALADYLTTGDVDRLPIVPVEPKPVRFHALAQWTPRLLMTAAQIGSRRF
jgi:glycine/D-amino acid oxidase-like deaminating enzyme